MDPLIAQWKSIPNPPDVKEISRRLIDLFLVSVLLDAGAGNAWSFKEQSSGLSFSRSEGLGVASIAMFEQGLFSGDPSNPYQVDGLSPNMHPQSMIYSRNFLAKGLSNIDASKVASAMQVSDANPMVGLEGRSSLLVNLSKALLSNATYFGAVGRPGHIVGAHPICTHTRDAQL